MRRSMLLAGVLCLVSAFLGAVLALSVAVPTIVDAQEARIRAESVTLVGAGTDRLRLVTQWDGRGGNIISLAPDGTRRFVLSAGGIDVEDPDGSGISIFAQDGTTVARFGMGHGPLGNLPLSTSLIFWDQQGQARMRLSVAENGTPSMLMYDADGAVIWSAP